MDKKSKKRTDVILSSDTPNAAVIVELRATPIFPLIVHHNMRMLGKDWKLYVFHGTSNAEYVRSGLARAGVRGTGLNFVNLGVTTLNDSSYNHLLKAKSFWNLFLAARPQEIKRCLVFQIDAIILRPGIEAFLQFDYTGAPWHQENDMYSGLNEERVAVTPLQRSVRVGNGGLSLRSPRAMLSVIEGFGHATSDAEQEDVFFVRHMMDKRASYRVATLQEGARFALEVPLEKGAYNGGPVEPWGLHQSWFYNDVDLINKLLQSSLGVHSD